MSQVFPSGCGGSGSDPSASASSSGGNASSGSGSSGAFGSSGSGSGGVPPQPAARAAAGGGASGSSSSASGGGSASGSSSGSSSGAPGGGAGLELWHPTVLPFTSTGTYTNPYMQDSMAATFTGPGGAILKIPGYCTGGSTWAVRFSPTAVGAWTYTTQSMDAGLNGKTGSIDCVANKNKSLHGQLHVDMANPTLLKYEDGTPYFQLSYEADWLGLIDLAPTDTLARHAKLLIDTIAANGACVAGM